MLKIFNNLSVFFEDCYRRISVREYSQLMKISPPTASKILNELHQKDILKKEEFRNFLFFHANITNQLFVSLSQVYWKIKLQELITYLEKELANPTIILFGSLSKGEVTGNSDIDLGIFSEKRQINIKSLEKKLKRDIQIFWFKSLNDVKPEELKKNIMNGYLLLGRL